MHTEQLLSALRASTVGGAKPQNRTKVFPVQNSPFPKRGQSHDKADTNAPHAQPLPNPDWHKATSRKNRSVADLRKAFERESGAKIPQRSSVSLPNTPQRQLSRQVGTQTKVFEITGPSCRRRDPGPDGKLRGAVNLETPVTPAQHSRLWSRLPVFQSQNTSTVRQAEGRALRESLVDELAQTIRHRAGPLKPGNIVHQAPVSTTDPRSDSSRPLLLARTLPSKAYTGRPASSNGIPKPSPNRRAKQKTDPLPEVRHHAIEARRARTGPFGTQSLQHWGTRKDSAPGSQPKPIRASHTQGFLDGLAETTSEVLQSQTSGARESPVRDGIHAFEQFGRSAGNREARQRNATSSGESFNQVNGRQPSWGLKLGSHTLRAVSLGVRRKLSTGKGQSEASNGGPKSSIPIFKRHTLPYFGTAGPSELLVTKPKREPSFSLRATLRKISKSHHSTHAASLAATRPRPKATPSIELLNKTSKIAPRPFPSIRTLSRRPRHKSSLGDALGGSWGKTAATTLLSEAPAVARDIASHTARSGFHAHTHSSRNGSGQSWGRRAAAREGPVLAAGVRSSGRVESEAAGTDVGGAMDKAASGGLVGKSESGERLGLTSPAPGIRGE